MFKKHIKQYIYYTLIQTLINEKLIGEGAV